jgi:hypothetical protein
MGDSIKMNLREIQGLESIYPPRDKYQRRALVDMVMNLLVPQNNVNFMKHDSNAQIKEYYTCAEYITHGRNDTV